MPTAFKNTGGDARVPRTLFQHAHIDGENTFPAQAFLKTTEIFLLFPDNWNGLDKLYLWLLCSGTEAGLDLDVTINIATTGETYNNHTQNVVPVTFNGTINEYIRVDLTTLFATVLANLQPNDMMWIVASWDSGDTMTYMIGAEAQET